LKLASFTVRVPLSWVKAKVVGILEGLKGRSVRVFLQGLSKVSSHMFDLLLALSGLGGDHLLG
jgi:hypothetical protein